MEAMEILFTGSSKVEPNFEVRFVELEPRTPTRVDEVEVTAFPAAHFSGAPSYSLRVEVEQKVFVYSGDTQWTDTLIEASDQADLFACECYVFDKDVALHNTYQAIMQHRPRLTCKRLILTHMSEENRDRAKGRLDPGGGCLNETGSGTCRSCPRRGLVGLFDDVSHG
jgi:ribonuclease BN (tRNA processing enzyme)